jgi:hypothetical protein
MKGYTEGWEMGEEGGMGPKKVIDRKEKYVVISLPSTNFFV